MCFQRIKIATRVKQGGYDHISTGAGEAVKMGDSHRKVPSSPGSEACLRLRSPLFDELSVLTSDPECKNGGVFERTVNRKIFKKTLGAPYIVLL
jgi:hypothetical protein